MRANAGESFTGSPALLHERKVNHAELIIEVRCLNLRSATLLQN